MMLDVLKIVAALGVRVEEHGHEANGLCPQHARRTGKEDANPSWWINLESGQHICFSCGYKGNILQLICDINEFYTKGWANDVAYDYASAHTWLTQVDVISPEKLMEALQNLPKYLEPAPKPLSMSEARLVVFVPPPTDALESRKITAESAKKYGVLWDDNTKTWILPLREPHFNKLMGWQEKGTVNRTFFNRPAGLQKSKTLFGIENQNEDTVVVVESPLDCLRMDTAGVLGTVAICGSSISDEQVKLLRFSNKVIAAFDTDNAGRKASKDLLTFARKYGINLFFFNYGDTGKKDPGDLTDEEIAWGIQNAKSSILGEQAYV